MLSTIFPISRLANSNISSFADLGFEQISVEPVVAGADADYALGEEDVPLLLEEYDKLALEYLKYLII